MASHVSKLPICVFATGVFLLLCSIPNDTFIAAYHQETPISTCVNVFEDPTTWHWWYNATVYHDHVPPYIHGTRCSYQCPANCTCGLGRFSVPINCTDGRVLMGTFRYPARVIYLSWAESTLHTLKRDAFADVSGMLEALHLNGVELKSLQPEVFTGLAKLQLLDLRGNALAEIRSGVFDGLAELERLDLGDNKLEAITFRVFQGVTRLEWLGLYSNLLREIQPGAFQGLTQLERLFLRNNSLQEIPPNIFRDMYNLLVLSISFNQLTFLYPETFQNQSRLDWLDLSHNQIQSLSHGLFQNLKQLQRLDLSDNSLSKLNSASFQDCVLLKTLNLSQNPLLYINKAVFNGLSLTTNIFVDQFSTCCYVESARCNYALSRSAFLSCGRLLPYHMERVAVWVLSIAIIFGNILVLFFRFRPQHQSNKVQMFLIVNLSIADLFMGIYLMMLLLVDLNWGDNFPSYSESWRQSMLCKTVGVLSVFSCEASVFIITLIAIDRFLGIKYPFSSYRLGMKSARVVVSYLWAVAFAISLTSFNLRGTGQDIYSVSEMCVALPITTGSLYVSELAETSLHSVMIEEAAGHNIAGGKPGMFFGTAVFAGLNLVCFTIVGICYLLIVISVRRSAIQNGRSVRLSEEIRLTMKISLIVLTDLCCWVPLGVLAILVQLGIVTTSPMAYVWITTFVLPLNSCINPFLYTLASVVPETQTYRRFRSWLSSHRSGRADRNVIQMRTLNP